jgi:hypothetical protein
MTTAINIPTGDDKVPKMSVYRYDTLNYGHQEIRTILLLPGTPSSPICCTLETHHLNAVSLQYETLSYEWGDSKSEERSIFLNDQEIHMKGKSAVSANSPPVPR